MTVVKSEFLLALNQVASERNIPAEDVLSSIELATMVTSRKTSFSRISNFSLLKTIIGSSSSAAAVRW